MNPSYAELKALPQLCRRNVKAESLEYEQVQELLEIRPQEDASYSADWGANRQRALGLLSHIADSATPLERPSLSLSKCYHI